MSSVVSFVVGGNSFTTLRDTILKEPASRLALILRGVLPTVRDDKSNIFLDRDPKHFQLILNYLRDGWCLLPRSSEERRELLQEARFYQLVGFEAWIRTQELLGDRSDALPPAVTLSSALEREFKRSHSTRSYSPTRPEPYQPSALSNPSSPLTSPRPVSPISSLSASFDRLPVSPASPHRVPSPAVGEGYKWTAKYLDTNERLRSVVETLLEMAYLPPHRSLHVGKVSITWTVDCDHSRIASLIGAPHEYLRSKYQNIQVRGAMGWIYEFPVRPSSDHSLYEKYAIQDYVQDNWFVLCAVLKDMYGVVMEEDASARPACHGCRRTNLSIALHKCY